MTVAKARTGWRVVLGAVALATTWLVGVWPPPVWWRHHEPRCTAMMRRRDPACPPPHVTRLDGISPLVIGMVLLSEDARDPVLKRLAAIVRENTQRLNRLVEDVLRVARREPPLQLAPCCAAI